MQVLHDTGIILSVRKYGDYNGIAHIFTRMNGLVSGMARGAYGSKHRGVYQPGNIVTLEWKARLEDQLGVLTCTQETAVAAYVIERPAALATLQAACILVDRTMQERDAHPNLYDALWDICACLVRDAGWRRAYAQFEMMLLSECGFRLDLNRCAVTGATDGLCYISPKTGRAVSAEGAGEYKEKLLPFPHEENIEDALYVSGYFMRKWLFASLGREMPAARERAVAHIVGDGQ